MEGSSLLSHIYRPYTSPCSYIKDILRVGANWGEMQFVVHHEQVDVVEDIESVCLQREYVAVGLLRGAQALTDLSCSVYECRILLIALPRFFYGSIDILRRWETNIYCNQDR